MEMIYHPVSGEKGYFASEMEKGMIDKVLLLFQSQKFLPCSSECGGENE